MGDAGGETLRVGSMGRGKHHPSRSGALFRQAVMHVGGHQQAEARMMVLGVVPEEEDLAVGAGVLDRAEPRRKRRAVLQRLELSFRERISRARVAVVGMITVTGPISENRVRLGPVARAEASVGPWPRSPRVLGAPCGL